MSVITTCHDCRTSKICVHVMRGDNALAYEDIWLCTHCLNRPGPREHRSIWGLLGLVLAFLLFEAIVVAVARQLGS